MTQPVDVAAYAAVKQFLFATEDIFNPIMDNFPASIQARFMAQAELWRNFRDRLGEKAAETDDTPEARVFRLGMIKFADSLIRAIDISAGLIEREKDWLERGMQRKTQIAERWPVMAPSEIDIVLPFLKETAPAVYTIALFAYFDRFGFGSPNSPQPGRSGNSKPAP